MFSLVVACRFPLQSLVRGVLTSPARHVVTVESAAVFNLFQVVSGTSLASMEADKARAVVPDTIEVHGKKVHYDRTGMGRHFLLLLPGALGCVKTDFQHQMDNLSKDLFTTISWDPSGYGRSIPPNREWPLHFLERDAEDAAKLMQNLKIDKYSLLGWSDGGITALMIAARYPDRIKKLIVWGAAAYVTKDELPIYETLRDIGSWSAEMRKTFLSVYDEPYFRKLFNDWVDAYSRYYTERNGDICKSELKNITSPTLILHGEKDPLVPRFHPEYLVGNIKNAQVQYFPDGKHNIHQRYFKVFNSSVQQFLVQPSSHP